jgi:hypothetical protein
MDQSKATNKAIQKNKDHSHKQMPKFLIITPVNLTVGKIV